MNLKDRLIDAAKYWEPRRLIYNGILLALSLICWGPEIFAGGPTHWLGGGLVLFGFAILANALYCLAYPVDVILQITPIKQWWTKYRWLPFSLGTLLAGGVALEVLIGAGMP